MTTPGALPESRETRFGSPLASRKRVVSAAIMIAACTLTFGALVVSGAVAPRPALAAAGIILAAAAAVLWWIGDESDTLGGAPAADMPAPSGDAALSRIITALPHPAVALDGSFTVVAINAPASALAPALRQGTSALMVLRLPALVEAIRTAAATGEAQHAEFSERVPVDRWYRAQVVPIPAASPEERRWLLLTFDDLTPLRRVEETRADFVANASHELRTPLAALSGFIDTLQGSARDDAAAREEFLGIMKEQARRMARLIDDLLSLSRVELNAHIPPQGTADLAAILRQVSDSLQMLAREREVQIDVVAPDTLNVAGDPDELMRVFENLVENALKYGGAGNRVEVNVAAGEDAREAHVSVRDFGPGIPPEHLPRLTERFYRVDVGHSRAEGGTGLGLALVKHILTRHRGRLIIESQIGAGATFKAILPMHPANR